MSDRTKIIARDARPRELRTNLVARPASQSANDPSKPLTGVHPATIGIGLGTTLWFLAVTWVAFARGGEIDWDLVVVTLFFAFFLGLFLLAASYAVKDPRWKLDKTSFREFLRRDVGTATGPVSGREVLLEIAFLPIVLALAATAIGIVCMAAQ